MKGQTILISGATSGIGKAAAFSLAPDGYRIVFIARNESRARSTREELIEKSGNENIEFLLGDLSEVSGVKNIADEFKSRFDRLDILVNNAGGYFHRRKTTSDGYEYTFALNHLSYFELTLLLMDPLRKSGNARIVNVASEAARTGHINFDDLMMKKKYSGIRAYCQSKLANLIFTYELARRLKGTGITVNAIHPGAVRTNFGNDVEGIFRFLFRLYIPFMRTPEKGAETMVYLARSPEIEGVTGKYFHDLKEIRSSRESHDSSVSERLWKKSLELTKLGLYDIK